MDTLDNLLESIAFENFTTNIHLAGLMNGGDQGALTPNNNINQKTDTLNRYFDNLINFDRECEKSNMTRKSSSPSSSDHSSDHQNNNGRMPQVNQHPFIFFTVNVKQSSSPSSCLELFLPLNRLVHEMSPNINYKIYLLLFSLFRHVMNQFHHIVRKRKLKFHVLKLQPSLLHHERQSTLAATHTCRQRVQQCNGETFLLIFLDFLS
jgi:hypothetical protein